MTTKNIHVGESEAAIPIIIFVLYQNDSSFVIIDGKNITVRHSHKIIAMNTPEKEQLTRLRQWTLILLRKQWTKKLIVSRVLASTKILMVTFISMVFPSEIK